MAKDMGPINGSVNKAVGMTAAVSALGGADPETLAKLLEYLQTQTAQSELDFRAKQLAVLKAEREEAEFLQSQQEIKDRAIQMAQAEEERRIKRRREQASCPHFSSGAGVMASGKVIEMKAPGNKSTFMCIKCAKTWALKPNGTILDEFDMPLPSHLYPTDDQVGGFAG